MIYEKIKALAIERKLSIKEIDQRAGLANGTIGKWAESTPRVDNLQAVAKVLGVSLESLVQE